MKVKNWDKFQHFKDRKPPWIKLHREIMEQRDINMISDCSFRVLIGLWLLASEDPKKAGNLPEIDDIEFRLRIDKKKIINSLKELGNFIEIDDINMISRRYQSDSPETETETEKELEKDIDRFDDFWSEYPKKTGKKDCLKIWKSRKLNLLAEKIILDVKNRQIRDTGWIDGFIPNPKTYLNGDRWEDQIQTRGKNHENIQRNLSAAERVELANRITPEDLEQFREEPPGWIDSTTG